MRKDKDEDWHNIEKPALCVSAQYVWEKKN